MKIKWLGHATFLITSANGTRIMIDPYDPVGVLNYDKINEPADIVTVSHDHFDHNNVAAVRGNPEVVKTTAETKGISFMGIPSYHDETEGKQRGENTIFCFEADGVKICHLGDLGHELNAKQVTDIGKVDLLFIPVGGFYTIDAKTARRVCDQLKPRVIIPMHYKNARCKDSPISDVSEFLQGEKNVKQLNTSEIEVKSKELTTDTQIMVFEPAL
ncbi:MBL fold metallo-hydrolase [Chloroflexota bacterium]